MNYRERFIYFAGIVDGEGTISIRKSKKYETKYYYDVVLQIGNTDIKLIKWVEKYFGGKGGLLTENRGKGKPMYRWNVFSIKATKIIKIIKPYLLLKKKQADLVLKFFDEKRKDNCSGPYRPVTKKMINRREKYVRAIRKLNKRGIS